MIDGPYTNWKPTVEEWYRIKFGSVLYVDKEGFLSSAEKDHGAPAKPRTDEEHNDLSSLISESRRETHATRRPAENVDPETFRQMLSMGGPAGYGAIRPGDLPPANLFMNSPSFSDSSATSTPSGFSEPGGPDTTNRIQGVGRGANGAQVVGGTSPILPMELMIYNDLMTDIGGTARVLGQEFQDSVLFGPTPASSPPPVGQRPDQIPVSQPPGTMYG